MLNPYSALLPTLTMTFCWAPRTPSLALHPTASLVEFYVYAVLSELRPPLGLRSVKMVESNSLGIVASTVAKQLTTAATRCRWCEFGKADVGWIYTVKVDQKTVAIEGILEFKQV